MISVGRARLGAGPAGDRPYVMPLLRTTAIVFALVMTIVWGTSYVRPLALRVSRTPQQAWFLDASHGRLRLTHQRVSPGGNKGDGNL
jgi:hypothetical protein